jgi:predicted aspartyl protease
VAASCALEKLTDIPVSMIGNQPMVSASIDGHALTFVIDSGAFYSIVTPSVASGLHLQPMKWATDFMIEGVGGASDYDVARAKSFSWGGRQFADVDFIIAPVTGLGKASAGVLGRNVLSRWDVEFDLNDGIIRQFRPHDCGSLNLAYWATGKPVSILDLRYEEGPHKAFTADAYLNGQKLRVLFDTGAAVSMVGLRAAARAGIGPGSPDVVAAGMTNGIGPNRVQTWIAPVTSFRIADEEIRATHLRIGDLNLDDVDMLVGADFFKSHRIYVANSQRQLYFTYNGGEVFDLSHAGPSPP